MKTVQACLHHIKTVRDRDSICFEGACLDSGSEKSVCGFAQAKLYARRTQVPLRMAKARIQFKFGNMTLISIGSIMFNLPTPRGVIRTKVHVVQADVPLLLDLDILDKYKLVVNNVDDQLEGRSNLPNSKVLWNEKITREHGHPYLCPSFVINLSRTQLERFH
jgi:hypothetical protein